MKILKKDVILELEAPVKTWRFLAECVNVFNTEGIVKADRKGLKSAIVDPAHVVMISLFATKDYFKKYDIKIKSDKSDMEFGFDFEWLRQVGLCKVRGDYIANLKLMTDDTMWLTVETGFGVMRKRFFGIDTECLASPKIPNLKLNCSLGVRSKEIYEAFNMVSGISDYSRFEFDGINLIMSAEGEKRNEKSEDFHYNDFKLNVDYIEKNSKKAISFFSNEYIQTILKILKKMDGLSVRLGDSNPIEFNFVKFGEGKKNKGAFTGAILLAPRIEEE